MRDPIEDLKNFSEQGLTMNPLPAAEVRRRGDRMRRRNTALASIGGVAAALVAIATPVAVVANQGDERSDGSGMIATNTPSDQSSDRSWLTTIPESFPITDGIGGDDPQAAARTKVGDASVGVDDLSFCGAPAWSATSNDPVGPPVDVLGAEYGEPGTESINQRTLALYADGATARKAFTALRTAAEDCPESENQNGDTELVDVVETNLGGQDSFAFLRQFQSQGEEFPTGELDVYQVVLDGNALLVTSSHSMAGGDDALVQRELDREAGFVAPVAAAMDAFSGAPEQRPETDGDEPAAGAAIPDSFPLLDGLPTDDEASGERFGRQGPSRGLDPIVLEACDRSPTGLPTAVETLRAAWRDVAGAQERALMTFGSEEEAQLYAESVTRFFLECGSETTGGATKVYHVSQEDGVGDYAGSAVMGVEVDGEPAVGMQIVQAVRVGRAVLLVRVDEEQNVVSDGASAPSALTSEHLDRAQPVVEAMASIWA